MRQLKAPEVAPFCLLAGVAAMICSVSGAADPECLYIRTQAEAPPSGGDDPCSNTGGRGLVRHVDCLDNSTVHVCCQMPFRQDMQADRQVQVRLVLINGDLISHNCTKRVMCEAACKDGETGVYLLGRSAYLAPLPGDSDATKENIAAWAKGEAKTCFSKQVMDGNEEAFGGGSSDCENYCHQEYPECDPDMKESEVVRLYVQNARIPHLMGMHEFYDEWRARDGLNKALNMIL